MFKIFPKITKIKLKMSKIGQVDPKLRYCKNPTHDKKWGNCPPNPTAGLKTYWAPHACLGAAIISSSGRQEKPW